MRLLIRVNKNESLLIIKASFLRMSYTQISTYFSTKTYKITTLFRVIFTSQISFMNFTADMFIISYELLPQNFRVLKKKQLIMNFCSHSYEFLKKLIN